MKRMFVIFLIVLGVLLASCASAIPNEEDMDFSHDTFAGKFSYQDFLERYEDGMPSYVIDLRDQAYEKQSLVSATQAIEYLLGVMSDASRPWPLHGEDRIAYKLWYDPVTGIWRAEVTNLQRLTELKEVYGDLSGLTGGVGSLIYFRTDGELLYFEPQE